MRGQFPMWRLAPEPWIGLAIPFDPQFTDKAGPLKSAVETMAFDRQSKTWWMPRSYEPVVTNLVRSYGKFNIPDAAIDKARVDIYRDKVLLTGESVASDYAMLALHPTAPPGLVDWALSFWKNVFAYYGAPTTQLMQVEEAYARIMARAAAGAQPVSSAPRRAGE